MDTSHDPSTPHAWANSVSGQFGTAVLLTREGDGHPSSLLGGESQTQGAPDEDLITGRLPAPNTVLPNQPSQRQEHVAWGSEEVPP